MKCFRNNFVKFVFVGGVVFSQMVFAESLASPNANGAEVENQNVMANGSSAPTLSQVNLPQLSSEQRINRLEQQVANQQQLNIPTQLEQLQQEIEQLRGRLQVQAYELKRLREGYKISDTAQPKAADKVLPIKQSRGVLNPAGFIQEQDSYESAYNLIKNRQYPEAITAMQSYLKKFPQGRYLSNANYWLGELYLIQNNNKLAVGAFQTVINQFPQSNKVSDAILKLGFIYYDKGELDKAKTLLEKVEKQFPGTTVARLASTRLQDIHQQSSPSE